MAAAGGSNIDYEKIMRIVIISMKIAVCMWLQTEWAAMNMVSWPAALR